MHLDNNPSLMSYFFTSLMPAYEGRNNLVASCEINAWLRLKYTSCMVLSHENTPNLFQTEVEVLPITI